MGIHVMRHIREGAIVPPPTGAFGRAGSLDAHVQAHLLSPTPPMRSLIVLLGVLLLTSCRDPRAEANIAEAMVQVGTEISAMRQDYALLQNQVDSLRGVVARQDTMITRLATLANMPLPPR
jgi:hypothetical protein